MKITALSDPHGYLPDNIKKCDVVCICGDIVPLDYQWNKYRSIAWFYNVFMPWCEKLKCKKVIVIAGNHDNFYEMVINEYEGKCACVDDFAEVIVDNNLLWYQDKVVYLHDSSYTYEGIKFYGTPYIPDLDGWAFYGDSEKLYRRFSKIPKDVDVLLTHCPGKFVNDTGVSLAKYNKPEYGSEELTETVLEKKPRYWICGHVHTGNHNMTKWNGINVVNVSLLNENYNVEFETFTFNLSKRRKSQKK